MDTETTHDGESAIVAPRHRRRRSAVMGSAVALAGGSAAGLLALSIGTSGAAMTLVVDTLDDGAANPSDCLTPVANSCSLRDATAAVADGDTITFVSGLTGTITLTNGEIHVYHGATITGPGSADLTIDANHASRVFVLNGLGEDFTFSGLTLTHGQTQMASDKGGAMKGFYARDIVLDDMVFDANSTLRNSASGGGGGAAAFGNSGSLTISDSTFTDDHADRMGGALNITTLGDVTITRTTVSGNTTGQRGGGVYISRYNAYELVDLSITDSTFSNNEAPQEGGGAYIAWGGGGSVSIQGTTFSGNSAKRNGVGLFIEGREAPVSINNSTFTSNVGPSAYGTQYGYKGGGAYVYYAASVTVSNSTFDSNTASVMGGGLGVGRSGPTVVNNSTFTGNTSLGTGGGIGAYNTDLTINQSTISANTASGSAGAPTGGGGGIYLYGTDLTLSGSIVSGNANDDPSFTVGADIESNQRGYLSLLSSSSIVGHYPTGDLDDLGGTIVSSDPGLYALADNGGPTRTMALKPTSSAIDAGPDPIPSFTGNLYDQRGAPRPTGLSGDIGAFEFGGTPAPTTSTTSTTRPSTTTSTSTSTTSTSTTSTSMYMPTTTTSLYFPPSTTTTTMYMPTTTTSMYIPTTTTSTTLYVPVTTTSTSVYIPSTTTSTTVFDPSTTTTYVAPTTTSTTSISSTTTTPGTSSTTSPSTTSTTIGSTTTTTPGDPSTSTTIDVRPVAPATPVDGERLELPTGDARIIETDGSTTSAPVITTSVNSVLAGSRTFGAELTGTRADGDGHLTFTIGTSGRVTGFGFQPGTTTSVWMMSNPESLGTVVAGADGTITLTFAVPTDVAVGDHTIQLQGTDGHGQSRAIAVGVAVVARSALPTTGTDPDLLLVVGGSMLLGGAGLGFTAQTRRRRIGGTSRSTGT